MLKPAVEVRSEGGILVAEFWDCLRLDPAPVQDLRKRFDEHLAAGGRPDLVVDLNGVAFAGSAALGGFLAIHRTIRGRGGRMVFCCVDPTVREVFRVSKIDTLLSVIEDRAGALDVLSRPPEAPAAPEAPRTGESRGGPLRRRRTGE